MSRTTRRYPRGKDLGDLRVHEQVTTPSSAIDGVDLNFFLAFRLFRDPRVFNSLSAIAGHSSVLDRIPKAIPKLSQTNVPHLRGRTFRVDGYRNSIHNVKLLSGLFFI